MKKAVRLIAFLLLAGMCVPVFASSRQSSDTSQIYFHDRAEKRARKLQKQQEKAMRKQMKAQKKLMKKQKKQAERDAKTWKHTRY